MSLSTLDVDSLLYLMTFLDPTYQGNLVLSGVLEDFEDLDQIADFSQRSVSIFCKLLRAVHILR
jgi:hypothetical protein